MDMPVRRTADRWERRNLAGRGRSRRPARSQVCDERPGNCPPEQRRDHEGESDAADKAERFDRFVVGLARTGPVRALLNQVLRLHPNLPRQ